MYLLVSFSLSVYTLIIYLLYNINAMTWFVKDVWCRIFVDKNGQMYKVEYLDYKDASNNNNGKIIQKKIIL